MEFANLVAECRGCKYIKHDNCPFIDQDLEKDEFCINCLRITADEYFRAIKQAALDCGYKAKGGK